MSGIATPRVSFPTIALALIASLALSVQAASAQCAGMPRCVLVWSDEFDGSEVDPSKWTF